MLSPPIWIDITKDVLNGQKLSHFMTLYIITVAFKYQASSYSLRRLVSSRHQVVDEQFNSICQICPSVRS